MNATLPLCIALGAVLLDALLGEPRRAHPLVAFGRLAGWLERSLHRDSIAAGLLAWTCAVLPPVALAALLQWGLWRWSPWAAAAGAALALYAALGLRSLGEHADAVAVALAGDDLPAAREAVGRIVSRDTGQLDQVQVAAAATESVLENGSDAVFAALFWGLLLGAPGAVLYRLSNTLDAMWGYRTPRFLRFGRAAARIDDALNWLPARLVALTYAVLGATGLALHCWRRQAPRWKSPNAGPVMAAGAGALRIRLGGPAPYHGHWQARPRLGEGRPADAAGVRGALRLVRAGVVLWLLLLALLAVGDLPPAVTMQPAGEIPPHA